MLNYFCFILSKLFLFLCFFKININQLYQYHNIIQVLLLKDYWSYIQNCCCKYLVIIWDLDTESLFWISPDLCVYFTMSRYVSRKIIIQLLVFYTRFSILVSFLYTFYTCNDEQIHVTTYPIYNLSNLQYFVECTHVLARGIVELMFRCWITCSIGESPGVIVIVLVRTLLLLCGHRLWPYKRIIFVQW